VAEQSKSALDRIGWSILHELQHNARIPYAELARRVHLSTPAVIERVRRMEEAGIIEGYRTELSCPHLGYPIMAFVGVSVVGNGLGRITRVMNETPEVTECYRVTGADSFLLKVCVSSVDHLQKIIDRFTPYVSTTTSIVLSTAVKRRNPDYQKTG
jgi:Lrp/AsnC family leucine-responsive transcriptional regulator